MGWSFTIVDVFTERPLAGNQLAVFVDGADIPEPLLQPLACEVSFSESAFVYPPQRGGDIRLRIFSPKTELSFAGHPVLGAAVVVGARSGADIVRVETGAGITEVNLRRDGDRVIGGSMRQAVPVVTPFRNPGPLLAALGVDRSTLPVEIYDNGLLNLYVGFESRDAVRALHPDPYDLATIARERGMPNVSINCFAGAGNAWKLRMFSPAMGVPEDPASGSAAGPLAVHLVRYGLVAPGVELDIRQGAEIGRPSVLHAIAHGDPDRIERVEVFGGARIVGRGEFDPEVLAALLPG
jgi:trans-2,3-dihydro-3-hydroxyanthranilate isomerase